MDALSACGCNCCHASLWSEQAQAWLELLPRLRGLSSRTSQHIRAQGACTHEHIVTVRVIQSSSV